ncbi:MAG: pyrimidine dimer DNA glycosylase/endonuclease V [Propionibacterium sp.]
MWSLHPQYLDRAGLLGCWRESLLAQAVLAGRTKGYRHHPQLERFRAQPAPLRAIASYLGGLADEGDRRGYHLDRSRIIEEGLREPAPLPVSDGQLEFERAHLLAKLTARSPAAAVRLESVPPARTLVHPLFHVVPGPIAGWERP